MVAYTTKSGTAALAATVAVAVADAAFATGAAAAAAFASITCLRRGSDVLNPIILLFWWHRLLELS